MTTQTPRNYVLVSIPADLASEITAYLEAHRAGRPGLRVDLPGWLRAAARRQLAAEQAPKPEATPEPAPEPKAELEPKAEPEPKATAAPEVQAARPPAPQRRPDGVARDEQEIVRLIGEIGKTRAPGHYLGCLRRAVENLLTHYRAGVPMVTPAGAGRPVWFYTVRRACQGWQESTPGLVAMVPKLKQLLDLTATP